MFAIYLYNLHIRYTIYIKIYILFIYIVFNIHNTNIRHIRHIRATGLYWLAHPQWSRSVTLSSVMSKVTESMKCIDVPLMYVCKSADIKRKDYMIG